MNDTANMKIDISPELGRNIDACCEYLNSNQVPLEFAKRSFQILERLLDTTYFFNESILIQRGDDTTTTSKSAITLYPSDSLRVLFATILAGDFNSVFFEHAYSLSQTESIEQIGENSTETA